ncbi:L,D-transpeptidase family protein [bacterium]|nr:L,D-transpeptidase family protein [bacterium]
MRVFFTILLFLSTTLFAKNRPEIAREETKESIKELFKKNEVTYPSEIFLRALKLEKKLELFVKKDGKFQLLKTYPICASSGDLGPKRRQGDLQVPEGFYHIHHFNPVSNFYLSLGVSYPNESDKIFKTGRDAGGAIYIHGDCVTIGCLPITDSRIKELYTIASDSLKKQKKIPVYIFPCDFNSEKCQKELKNYPQHSDFWKNIKEGFDYFETNKSLPKITINKKGKYIFK